MSRMVRGCRAKEKKRHLSAAQGRLSSAPIAVSTIVDFFLIGRKRVTHVFSLFAVQETDRQEEKKKKVFFLPQLECCCRRPFFFDSISTIVSSRRWTTTTTTTVDSPRQFLFPFFWGGLLFYICRFIIIGRHPHKKKKKENVGHLSFDYLLKNILEEIIVGLSKEQNKQIKTTKIKIIE